MMKTYVPKQGEIRHDWYVIDAADVVLGRLSTKVATLLRGKHKAIFTPGLDTGDFVIVVNADKVKLTGNKWDDKKYYRHSGDPGHLHQQTAVWCALRFGGCCRRTGWAASFSGSSRSTPERNTPTRRSSRRS
jgi:ribosomal protein L13